MGGQLYVLNCYPKKRHEKETSFKFLNKLKLVDISNNLGDSKTLITHPYTTTHHRLSIKEKKN